MILIWLKNLLKIVRGREHHQVVFSIHRCWLGQVWTQYNLVSWGQVYILCLLGHTHMHVEQFSLLQPELLLIKFDIIPLESL